MIGVASFLVALCSVDAAVVRGVVTTVASPLLALIGWYGVVVVLLVLVLGWRVRKLQTSAVESRVRRACPAAA